MYGCLVIIVCLIKLSSLDLLIQNLCGIIFIYFGIIIIIMIYVFYFLNNYKWNISSRSSDSGQPPTTLAAFPLSSFIDILWYIYMCVLSASVPVFSTSTVPICKCWSKQKYNKHRKHSIVKVLKCLS